ncbi:hypothetical protein DPMN_007185 [Dreissena polymorpha]|uniref:Uncharacterized protein n=1 Tax=Dreissena polymorpha TaxID=45954 RepID=A0A9D4RVS4_DREPO|nr:hypothetical protein DPMN_007185 [Dreissena polymorpha]
MLVQPGNARTLVRPPRDQYMCNYFNQGSCRLRYVFFGTASRSGHEQELNNGEWKTSGGGLGICGLIWSTFQLFKPKRVGRVNVEWTKRSIRITVDIADTDANNPVFSFRMGCACQQWGLNSIWTPNGM